MTRVTIVGLGLIGGSIALALRALGIKLIAADKPDVLSSELCASVVDERVDSTDAGALAAAARDSDLVVLSAPVSANQRLLPVVLEHARAVTDTGSTKRTIVALASSLPRAEHFVAGHPMAGRADNGLASASAGLFLGRPWIVCADERQTAATRRVEELIKRVGGVAVHMTPEQHDRAVALTSHVPQVLASALVVLAHEREAERARGPAFEHMTRTAGGEPSMWRDVFATNADEVAAALQALGHELLGLASNLGRSPPDLAPLLSLLGHARRVKSGH